MGFTVLIPARLSSTRLPRKPLADLEGLPMIVRVARRSAGSAAERVVVAADDAEIVQTCAAHGVAAVLTDPAHPTGSDRLAEAATRLGLPDESIVVNVQGDEPLLDAGLVNACAALLEANDDCVMSTAAHEIHHAAEFANPNVVKVLTDRRGIALAFSRAPIPWWRDRGGVPADPLPAPLPLRHIGLYAYRVGFLRRFPQLERSPHEAIEALEQLRVLWHGQRIAVHVTADAPGPGVDTPEDLERVRRILRDDPAR